MIYKWVEVGILYIFYVVYFDGFCDDYFFFE